MFWYTCCLQITVSCWKKWQRSSFVAQNNCIEYVHNIMWHFYVIALWLPSISVISAYIVVDDSLLESQVGDIVDQRGRESYWHGWQWRTATCYCNNNNKNSAHYITRYWYSSFNSKTLRIGGEHMWNDFLYIFIQQTISTVS